MLSNVGAERAVLSGLCQYGRQGLADVEDLISSSSFTELFNQIIYECVLKVIEQQDKVDISSILAIATSLGYNEKIMKSMDYIRAIYNFPIELDNIRTQAKILAKLEYGRRAQEKHKEVYNKLGNIKGTESISDIIALSEKPIFDLTLSLQSTDENPELVGEDAEELLQYLLDNPIDMIGIPTPWPRFNEVIGGGIRPGVTLIAMRPGVGKSTSAKDCALHVTENIGIPVLSIDTEMIKADQVHRAVAGISRTDIRQIETGQFAEKKDDVLAAGRKLKELPWFHKRVGGKAFPEILSIIRRWIFKEVGFDENGKVKPCLIIYDYFKLMDKDTLKEMAEYQAMGFQISDLSDFCMQYEIPCLAFVQSNRDGITKETSDIIAQSDRLLWLCTSCSVMREKTEEEIVEEGVENGNRKLFFLKTRFGEPLKKGDYLNFHLEGKYSLIKELKTRNEAYKEQKTKESGFETVTQEEDDEEIPF